MTVFLRGGNANASNLIRPSQPASQRPARPSRGVAIVGVSSGGSSFRWLYHALALLLVVVVVVVYLKPSSSSSTSASQLRSRKGTLAATKPTIVSPLLPSRVPDTEIFYLLPPETKTIQGLLLFFHGCQHTGGADFFLLPEDRIVAYEAVYRHSLIAVGFTSSDRLSGCWMNQDLPLVQQQMETLLAHLQLVLSTRTTQQNHPILQLPKYGMGASSGAEFVLKHATTLKLKRVAAYVPPRGTLDEISPQGLPPTILVHMPRDAHNAEAIDEWMKAHKVVKKADVTVLTVAAQPFTAERCQERIPEISPDICTTFIERAKAFKGDTLMDQKGFLVKSYVVTDGWSKIMATLPLDDAGSNSTSVNVPDGASDKSFSGHSWKWAALQEEIQVAYGRHEMTAEHCTQVLNFLQGHA